MKLADGWLQEGGDETVKYVITRTYVVEAENAEQAYQVLRYATQEGRDWIYQAEPERVIPMPAPKPKGWWTLVREQLLGKAA